MPQTFHNYRNKNYFMRGMTKKIDRKSRGRIASGQTRAATPRARERDRERERERERESPTEPRCIRTPASRRQMRRVRDCTGSAGGGRVGRPLPPVIGQSARRAGRRARANLGRRCTARAPSTCMHMHATHTRANFRVRVPHRRGECSGGKSCRRFRSARNRSWRRAAMQRARFGILRAD